MSNGLWGSDSKTDDEFRTHSKGASSNNLSGVTANTEKEMNQIDSEEIRTDLIRIGTFSFQFYPIDKLFYSLYD
jgi:hypothetical protein